MIGADTLAEVEELLSRMSPEERPEFGCLVDRHTGRMHRWEYGHGRAGAFAAILGTRAAGWRHLYRLPFLVKSLLQHAEA